jgi:hypothetical protein
VSLPTEEDADAAMNGHDPYAYLRDVLERLPTQPHRGTAAASMDASGSHVTPISQLGKMTCLAAYDRSKA